MTTIVDTTWQERLVKSPSASLRQRRMITGDIDAQLSAFLTCEIAEHRPEKIIVVERRGTAIVRALKESSEHQLDLAWNNVISSRALDQLPDGFLKGRRILVFDDLMRMGSHVKRVLKTLRDCQKVDVDSETVKIAVFAMHEEAMNSSTFPHFGARYTWFHSDLTTTAYRNIRLAILSMLQKTGSLMLDTEHIEVRVRVKRRDHSDFLAALGRRTKTIEFHSLNNRRNITVLYPDKDDAFMVDRNRLPLDIITEDIVKKCRVIQRAPNEYALIPICYPDVISFTESWPTISQDVELLGEGIMRTDRSRFYGAALIAALNVLEWILKALYAAGEGLVDIRTPSVSVTDPSRGEYSLEHLLVMYPTLDLGALINEIDRINGTARREGKKVTGEDRARQAPQDMGDDELRRDAWNLLQIVRSTLDKRMAEERLLDPRWRVADDFGLMAREIFSIGDLFGWSRVHTSSLFDILIDDGHLVTHVTEEGNELGDTSCFRVFEPDGEMVSELVRLYTMQRGLPNGF